ncbi:sensor histidine kinase [Streptomyces gardneri]|uniref:histidine kinase n=1 Tax=Streptomyces gardneri TaxID=66892 RepID=A0A4Y3RUT0_9ACTN|nr:histidine kinase [Streptomyces gardneri]GEB61064.1 two-component sensor histidine kinase [Streptomyces gardneri]GHG84071.1 two-component sensor histidine kinase [Streptomyces gardneri]
MIKGLRPLLSRSTYSGALFAYGAVLASLPLLSFALVPALAWRSAPEGVQIVVVLLVWAALIGLVGLARTTRRVLVVSARRLLRVSLPEPVAVRTPTSRPGDGPAAAVASHVDRWRTPLWLLLHVTLGWTGALASGVLLFAGLTLPGGWLDAELGLSLFGRTVRVDGGWQSWAVALGCLLLAASVCVVVTKALRWSAPRLLGPSAAERLALAAERELQLAERNRLAHELHDSIGHTLTTTTIQAAVAGEMLSADPEAARAALRSIEESSRAALEDLDYVLGVLRAREAETAPTRTLADLPELLDRLRHAGAVVELELSGDPAQVRGTLSRAAYRILQEGLTNAMRHGAGGPIEVRVAAAPDRLELDVVNRTGDGPRTGKGRAFPTSGHGLPGLTERVRLLHGEIDAGPDGPRHWRLTVRLPVRLSP